MRSKQLRQSIAFIAILCLTTTGLFAFDSPVNAATSAIDQRYNSEPALRQLLGAPTGAEYSVAGGRARTYQWGSLYWSSATGVHEVHGAIRARYGSLGGPAGRLGFPTTDEKNTYVKYDVPDQKTGARNNFQNGALIWDKEAAKTIWISKPFADAIPFGSYPFWGMPRADEKGTKDGARMVDFYGLMYQTSKGFFQLLGGYPGPNTILEKYRSLNIENGFLGLPVSNEIGVNAANGMREGDFQKFQGGRIYQCGTWYEPCGSDYRAFEVHGAILWKFDAIGGIAKIGYPVSDEMSTAGGKVSYFQKGKIFWNSSTNQTVVTYY